MKVHNSEHAAIYKVRFAALQHESFMQMSDLTATWLRKLGSGAILDMTMGDRYGQVSCEWISSGLPKANTHGRGSACFLRNKRLCKRGYKW